MDNQLSLLSPKQCPSWEGCSAPLCPIDKSFGLALWFPNEPICSALAYRGASWRRNQVKIARIAKDKETCYTARMLAAIQQVRGGIQGLAPENITDGEQVANWLTQRQCPSLDKKPPELAIGKDLVGVGNSQRHPE